MSLPESTLIYAGESHTVTLRDGSTRSVGLRLIKLSEIPTFLDAFATSEDRALAYALQLPEGAPALEFDDLTDESYTALVEANQTLNFTRALARSRERLKRAQDSAPALVSLAADLQSALSGFLLKSPSPAATPPPSSTP